MTRGKGPYGEGYDAFYDKLGLAQCPYPPNTDDEAEWQSGWLDASDEQDQP